MFKTLKRLSLIVPIIIISTLFSAHLAMAATTIAVNSFEDSADGAQTNDGKCTLREAVLAARMGVDYSSGAPECIYSGSAPYEINIPAGTYNLTNGDINIRGTTGQPLTITGAGRNQTIINGNGSSRIFYIQGTQDADLTINGSVFPSVAIRPNRHCSVSRN